MRNSISVFLLITIPLWSSFAQKPEISSISRITGPVGLSVVISGSGFSSDANNLDVRFGASSATVIEARENLLEVLIPGGTTYENISITNLTSGLTGYAQKPFLLSFGGDVLDESKFSNPFNFQSDPDLYDLCTCDFDGDGKNDVATANKESNTINVFHNTSTLTSISFVKIPLLINAFTLNIACRDLNGDGKPDIVVSRTGNVGDRIYWRKNNSTPGNISFANPEFELVNGNIARRIAIEDLDKDGLPEIIVTNQANNTFSILRNSSNGSTIDFEPFQAIEVNDPEFPDINTSGLDVGDFNGDGFPEIVLLTFLQSNVYVIPNRSQVGKITLGNAKRIRVPGNLVNVVVGDINIDGKDDIIVSKLITSQVGVLVNKFQPGTPPDNDNDIDFFDEVLFDVNTRPWGLDLGDMDGDGKVDIAVASINETEKRITVLRNVSSGANVSMEPKFITTPELTRNIKLADINGDAKPDIVATSIESFKISVFRNLNCVIPDVYPSEAQTICIGREVKLTATPAPGSSYEWFRKKDGVVDTSFPASDDPRLSDIPSVAGNYEYYVSLTSEGGACIQDSDPISVSVDAGTNPNPPSIIEPAPVCEGSQVILKVDNPLTGTYTWQAPSGNTVVGTEFLIAQTTFADAGKYTLEFQAPDGCTSEKDTTILEIITIPEITIVATNDIFCDGTTNKLTVTDDPSYTYVWKLDGSPINGATDSFYDASQTGTYMVEVTTLGNCTVSSASVDILAASPPTALFDTPASSCLGTEISFTNNSTVQDGINVFYNWDFGDGTTSSDDNPSKIYTSEGTYSVSLTVKYDDENCSDVTTSQIVIGAPPIITIDATLESFCQGESSTLSIDGTFASVLWSNGSTDQSIVIDTEALYTATVTTANGCEASAEKFIEVFDLPVIRIEASGTSIELGQTVQLTATGATSYTWEPETYLDNPNSATPVATPDTTISYTVTGIDANSCIGTSEVTIIVTQGDPEVEPEIVFTPNGDGINDNWVIRGLEEFPGSTLSVFTRNGQKVLEEDDYAQDWDGTFSGQALSEGVYYYVIVHDGTTVKSGAVTIVR